MVLDPIIDGLHFTQVLMDGGSDLNLLYQDTIRNMGIDPTKIRHSKTSFQGVTPGPDARCMGSLRLEVMFGSPDNFHREQLTFHIAPFSSSYQALWDVKLSPALTQYRIMHLLRLRCPVHAASL